MAGISPTSVILYLGVFLVTIWVAALGCGRNSRPGDDRPDAADSDSQDTDSGSDWLLEAGSPVGWGSAPGYRMTWAVGAGGPYNGDPAGDIAHSVSFSAGGDLFFGGRAYSDDVVFGLGTDNEIWSYDNGGGVLFVARYTEAGIPLWVSFIDSEGEYVSRVIALEDGSAIALGGVANFGNPAIFGAGEPGETAVDTEYDRLFLARYRSDGTLDWVRHSRGEDIVDSTGLAQATDGDTCVGAQYRSNIILDNGTLEGIVLENDGIDEGFIARFDEDGLARWARPVRGEEQGKNRMSATALPDGSCAFAGRFKQWITLPDGTDEEVLFEAEMEGDWSHFVARYDAEGDLVWFEDLGIAALTGGNSFFSLHRFIGLAALEQDVVVSGFFTGDLRAGTEEAPVMVNAGPDPDDRGLYVARLGGENGGRRWTTVVLGETEHLRPGDGADALAVLPDGGVVLGGSFTGRKVFGAGEEHETELLAIGDNSDAFLAVYEDEGSLRWASRVVSCPSLMQNQSYEGGEAITGLSVDDQGSIAASGWFLGWATFGTGPADAVKVMSLGSYDAFVLRLDPEGPVPNAR
jgi:hypothetical protein